MRAPRHILPLLAILAATTVLLSACGGSAHTAAQGANRVPESTAPSSAFCQAEAVKLTRARGCPEIVPSTTCKYTEAGVRLCGEDLREYCEQVASPSSHGCGPVGAQIARSGGDYTAAHNIEAAEARLYCARNSESQSEEYRCIREHHAGISEP
jgi:hypothetical protein